MHTVEECARKHKATVIPPVVLIKFEKDYMVVDGCHRASEYYRGSISKLDALVVHVTKDTWNFYVRESRPPTIALLRQMKF